MLGVTGRDKRRATRIREQTKIKDTTKITRRNELSLAILHEEVTTDGKKRVTEWQAINCKRSQGRQSGGEMK